MLSAVQLASRIKSGPGGLVDVVAQSLALALPEFLRFQFVARVSKPHAGTVSSLGSASLIQRYELSLDVALLLLQRRIESAYGNRVGRVAWTGSSPIVGYEWIWSKYHAIAQVFVLKTFSGGAKVATTFFNFSGNP